VLSNVGIDGTRFTVKKPSNPGITITHPKGLVAPGMSVTLTVRLNTANSSEKVISDEIQIVSESEILHVPVKAGTLINAVILSKEEFESTGKKLGSNIHKIAVNPLTKVQ
jgi:hypothetical protein